MLTIIRRLIVGVPMLSGKSNELLWNIVDELLWVFLFFLAQFRWCFLSGNFLGMVETRPCSFWRVGFWIFHFEIFRRNWLHYGSCEIGLIFAKSFCRRHLESSCQWDKLVKCADTSFLSIFDFFGQKTMSKNGHFLVKLGTKDKNSFLTQFHV